MLMELNLLPAPELVIPFIIDEEWLEP